MGNIKVKSVGVCVVGLAAALAMIAMATAGVERLDGAPVAAAGEVWLQSTIPAFSQRGRFMAEYD